MSKSTLSPYDLSAATKVGKRTYRKQVLPLGEITYKGTKIKFDKAFLTDLAASFKDGAYDQVPFVLATPTNAHNEDPARFRGEIKSLELTEDGLDAIVEVNKKGAQILEDNPRLGVSARIVQGLEKADGRTFKRAIRHVLGTMDPRVTGLRPWQAVDLSEDDDTEVVDLTAETYDQEGQMAKGNKKGKAQGQQAQGGVIEVDLSSFTDEEFLEFLDLAEDGEDPDAVPDPAASTVDDPDGDGDETVDVEVGVVEVDPDDIDPDDEDDEDEEDEEEEDETDLSDVLEDDERDETTRLRIDLAHERFKSERNTLLRAGVPRALIDLAEPLLSTPDPVTLDLSNTDEPVNATQVVRDVLEQVKGMIDLAPEVGHQVDLAADSEDADTRILEQWDAEYGKA